MDTGIENSYINYLKSKIKSRIEFFESYSLLFPELFLEEDVQYLKSIELADMELRGLKRVEKKNIKYRTSTGGLAAKV